MGMNNNAPAPQNPNLVFDHKRRQTEMVDALS
jgi:hypothetical protein